MVMGFELPEPMATPSPPKYGLKHLRTNVVTIIVLAVALILFGLVIKVIAVGVVGFLLLAAGLIGALMLWLARR